MSHELIFPYANIVTGVLLFIIAFVFHWVGQLISVVNWDFAMEIGLQEKKALPEYKVYEHGIACADVALGWIYGIAAVGLILNVGWAYQLAWFPAVVLIYHGLRAWFWSGNQKKAGHQIVSNRFLITWCFVTIVCGVLTVAVIW